MADAVCVGAQATAYGWSYTQGQNDLSRALSFGARLDNLRPGEVRRVSSGTVVSYTLESGSNSVSLPLSWLRRASA